MAKNGKRVDAELREHGEFGCECQFYHCGGFVSGRLCGTPEQAVGEAEAKRELEAVGWRNEKPAESAGFSESGTDSDDRGERPTIPTRLTAQPD